MIKYNTELQQFPFFEKEYNQNILSQKILPCVSLLVYYIMKKSNQAAKVNEFGKKVVCLQLYKTKYILQICIKFNYFKNIATKIFLCKRNSFALHF